MTLDERRDRRRRENAGYHRSRLERLEYELEGKLEVFKTAAQELGHDEAFDDVLPHVTAAAVELESALNAVRRAREALA